MERAELYNGYFSGRFSEHKQRDPIWKVIVSYLQKKFISPRARVLDLGTGYGNFINNVRAKEKHAIDLNNINERALTHNAVTLFSFLLLGNTRVNA
jgi:16S rRNA G1207 methylase RsmC